MTTLSYKIFIAACFLVGMISSSHLNILGAAYGKADVTDKVRSAINDDSIDITASNDAFGDSWYGTKKSLVIVYQYDDYRPTVLVTPENEDVSITEDSTDLQEWNADYSQDFGILGAAYGLADVTDELQTLLRDGESEIKASNTVFTDSWVNTEKTLVIVHQNTSGLPVVTIITENQSVDASIFLPEVTGFTETESVDASILLPEATVITETEFVDASIFLPEVTVITETESVDVPISLPELEIIKAAYGVADVTDIVKEAVSNQGGKSLDIMASNSVFEDSWVNTKKALVVVYRFANEDYQMEITKENESLSLSYI